MDKSKFTKVRKVTSIAPFENAVKIQPKFIKIGVAVHNKNKGIWGVDVYLNKNDQEVLLEFVEDGEYCISKLPAGVRFGGERIARTISNIVGTHPKAVEVDKHAVLLTRRN
jgi:hypothetical protein